MRKVIYSIAAIVLVTVAVLVWLRTASVPIRANIASPITLSQSQAGSTEATAPISPTDMMMNYRASLTTEQWDPI